MRNIGQGQKEIGDNRRRKGKGMKNNGNNKRRGRRNWAREFRTQRDRRR